MDGIIKSGFYYDVEYDKCLPGIGKVNKKINSTHHKNLNNLLVDNFKQDLKKNGMISSKLEYVTSELENMHRHYWLAGGTLLGWYRDCGIISHTKDVDLAIWSHEYDENILKLFMGNSIMNIWLVIGFVS